MKENKLPRPTPADYEKRREYEKSNAEKLFDDEKNEEYLEFLNSFNWSAELIKEADRYGLKNALGEEIIPPFFEDFRLMAGEDIATGSRVVAKQNGKWGVVLADGKGTRVLESIFDEIGYPNRLTYVIKEEKWGVIDLEKGKFLIPLECDGIDIDNGFMFMNGIAEYKKDGKFGVISENGQFTEAVFEEIRGEPEGNVSVKFNGEWGYIDENNKFTLNEDEAWYCWYID